MNKKILMENASIDERGESILKIYFGLMAHENYWQMTQERLLLKGSNGVNVARFCVISTLTCVEMYQF